MIHSTPQITRSKQHPSTRRAASAPGRMSWLAWVAGMLLSGPAGAMTVDNLLCEALRNPVGLDAEKVRLSWALAADRRGERQTAWQVLVASTPEKLARDDGDLWDSGRVSSEQSQQLEYGGKTPASGMVCHWKVRAWDRDGQPSAWSQPAKWSMGLLRPEDWKAQWISFRDNSPVPQNTDTLHLPPPRHYRKEFAAARPVLRATLYASALGICELRLNGRRVGDAFFEPGWCDYRKRAYYRTHDVTALVRQGDNAIGAIVADGWYSGYVGYALFCGYGPNRLGRFLYGKTPSLLAQLEIEYADGTRQTIASDVSWQVTENGPFREADFLMGESYDARAEMPGWDAAGFQGAGWLPAIRAEENGRVPATFHDPAGTHPVELGFQRPPRLQAYGAPPVRVTQELKPKSIKESSPGVHLFDFGQNFAGVIRLRVKGPAGTRLQMRYGEMLHPDGRLMTENLRRARATDFYTLRGDPAGESWTARFTYHGFQYLELSGLPEQPGPDTVTGLVLHSDTPWAGEFSCSDPVMTKFAENAQWTQRANFIEVPTDCPQRDERLGWMGDAQVYVRTAACFADVAAFFGKWMDDVEEAQRPEGPYPDYCPYPMAHGKPGLTFGTAWTDAGIICPWTIWQMYGDTRILSRHWDSMQRFMEWRRRADPQLRGVSIGNDWGDWLNVGEPTPIEYVDLCYHALDAKLMADMATAVGDAAAAVRYRQLFADTGASFRKQYLKPDGRLGVDTQTAYVLALWIGLIPEPLAPLAAEFLAAKIRQNDGRMTTGFLGTKPILAALSQNGQHDLAVRLFQSRRYPSWGYEVVNGATSVWERWDSFTREFGYNGADGKQNAAMNSFNHYSFGAVMEWAFRDLAGLDTQGAGFQHIILRPGVPSAAATTPGTEPLSWVRVGYQHPRGRINCQWRREGGRLTLDVAIPANTTATVYVPAKAAAGVLEGGQPAAQAEGVKFLRMEPAAAVYSIGSGTYHFSSEP